MTLSSGFGDAYQVVAAQAIQDGIASTPDGLTIRGLIPGLDLLDANKHIISSYTWQQTHLVENTDELIYGGINDGDEKVIAFTGVMGVGSNLWTNTIKFERGTSVANIINVQPLAIADESISHSVEFPPLIYRKGQGLKIYFNTKTGAINQTDNLMLVGAVAEPLGSNIAG